LQARYVFRAYCFITLLDRRQEPGLTPAALGIVEDRNSGLDRRFFLVGRLELGFIPLTCKWLGWVLLWKNRSRILLRRRLRSSDRSWVAVTSRAA
jgi:hypothetical protein